MKTSKKILSFFLAVVMVVTTCSVGFTAFAAEKNRTIWSTDADAKAAFSALNGLADDYLPSLLMGLVGDGVYKKIAREIGKEADALTAHEKAVIAGEASKQAGDADELRAATLSDILQALQPTLINALDSTTQTAFVENILKEQRDHADRYDYLNQRDDTLSVFTLIGLAEEFRYKSDVSSEAREALIEWVYGKKDGSANDYTDDSVWSIVQLYNKLYAEETNKETLVLRICDRFGDFYADGVSLYDIKNFDFKITEDEQAIVDSYISLYNTRTASYDVGIEIKDFADLAWYGFNTGFKYEITLLKFMDLIKLGGGSVDLVGNYDVTGLGTVNYNLTGLTKDNIVDEIIAATLAAKNTTIDKLIADGTYKNAEQAKSLLRRNICEKYLMDILYDGTENTIGYSSHYADVLKGYIVENSDYTLEALEAEIKAGLPTKALTDEEFADMASVIAGRSGNQSTNEFFTNGETTYYLGGKTDQPLKVYLPEALKGTIAADYFATIVNKSVVSNQPSEYKTAFFKTITGDEALYSPKYASDYSGSRAFTTDIDYDTFMQTYTVYYRNQNRIYQQSHGILRLNGGEVNNANYTASKDANGKLVIEFTENYWNGLNADYDYVFSIGLPALPPTSNRVTHIDEFNAITTQQNVNYGLQWTYDLSPITARINTATTPNGNYVLSNRDTDVDKFNQYIADSEKYAYIMKTIDLFGITEDYLSYNNDTALAGTNIDIMILEEQKSVEGIDLNISVELNEEQIKTLNKDIPLDGEYGTEIVNCILNDTIVGVLSNELLSGIISSMLDGEVDLVAAIEDIWERVCSDPLGTVFELLPLITTLVDSLILPLVFNNESDRGYGTLDMIIDTDIIRLVGGFIGLDITATDWTYEYGSYIGIDTLQFDLNRILPQLMDWLFADDQTKNDKKVANITYYDGSTHTYLEMLRDENGDVVQDENLVIQTTPKLIPASDVKDTDLNYYKAADQNGNALVKVEDKEKGIYYSYMGTTDGDLSKVLANHKDSVFTYSMTYEANVPHITGIYIADKALRDASIYDLPTLFSGKIKDADVATALAEVVTEFAKLFETSIDTFVASDFVNETRYNTRGEKVSSGLNNIFVAVPRLFDIMEDLAAEKYNATDDTDWTYCYEGRIIEVENKGTRNALLEKFNAFANSNDSNRKYDILDLFAEIFVENWLNAIFDLVNDLISGDNDIANNLPIVAGILNALGGFGENSIFTDIFNSVFQINRDSDYSFEFTDELSDENNKLTGLSKNTAFFLLSNIDRLVEVVMNLVGHFGSDDDEEKPPADDNTPTVKPKPVKPAKATEAKATSSNYSSSDLSNTKDLIGNLDKMLSSLLSDSTLNGFSLDSTENLVAGIVSLLDRFLGRDVNLGNNKELETNIVRLVNTYLYYITGESENLTAKGEKVDAKKVYTNNALTGLVVETYALIEQIADSALGNFYDTYDNDETLKYNLLVEAIDGIISPDAVGIRLADNDDYSDAGKKFTKYNSWTIMANDSSRSDYKKLNINWGFKNGDKEGFYDGLAASLRLVTSILGVLLIDTGWYDTVVTPVLGAFCDKNGIKLTSYETLVADKNKTGYYDETLIAIITPVSAWLNTLLKAPASTLIKSIQGLAGLIDDKNTKAGTIKSVLSGAITPITNELKGLAKIFTIESDNGLMATSPKLAEIIRDLANNKIGIYANPANIKLGNDPYTYGLSGNNLIPIINSYIADKGITLKLISWSKIYASTPEAALVYVLEYVIETLLDNKNLTALATIITNLVNKDKDKNNQIVPIIFEALKAGKIDAKGLLALINNVLKATDNPTLAYWTFAQYLQELTESFSYPAGITKAMADQGVDTLDNLVAGIFPLLGSFGVNLGADDLQGIIDKNLFKNELLTTIATALYGALDGLDPTLKSVLSALGLVSSTKDVAAILTDSSYGKTFTSAANTIKAQSSWENVKNVNWGFTDGSSKAQQGFVNALVAILRPLNDVLAVFLNEGTLELNDVVYDTLKTLNVSGSAKDLEIGGNIVAKITYTMKNGVLTVKIDDKSRKLSAASELKIDFNSLKSLKDLKIEGTNGYNSAIIPLLEAFKCSDIKTYSQYRSDVNSAKDNLLLDILNPIIGASENSLLSKLVDQPFTVLCDLLPNIAMYLDAHGLSQLINNLLAPITGLIADIAETIDIDGIVKELLGTDLNSLLSTLLGVNTKINLDLTDLSKLNIEDLVIPIIRIILAGSDNAALRSIKLYDIDWNALISLGTKSTYTSKATGANGSFLTGKTLTGVDQGKVLITVLRYIAKTLVANATPIKNLLLGIDAIKKSDILTSIIASIMNTIGTASADQIVAAIFYFAAGEPQNAFWDYTKYKTGEYTFAYPEGVDVEFLKNLSPMLDGLIGGLLDLNGLVNDNLFKDELISKLAKGLYGAIEGVKINDNLNLTSLLAQTDIDFSTTNVANLLVNKDYGKTFDSAAAAIRAAGTWKNVNVDSLKWGVTDRDSFFHALVAVLRPIYGVLDVLLNDGYLGLFDLVRLPGSNGYSSSIVPLMEAFSMYNIKTQYQYREDMSKEYDAILLDIINPLWDLVEDVLNAPIQTIASIVPNLALFIGNNGLCQIIDNLLTPISALADAIRPVVDLNDLLNTLLKSLKVDLNGILGKVGVTNFSLDLYDLNKTLKQILGADAIVPLLNSVLGLIKIKGTPLGLKLNDIDWLKLASHGTTIVSASQAATYGSRIYVEGDPSETLIAVLCYLIDTVNAGDNYEKITELIGGLLGDGVADNVSGMISKVLGMLKGDTNTVIAQLVEMLQIMA